MNEYENNKKILNPQISTYQSHAFIQMTQTITPPIDQLFQKENYIIQLFQKNTLKSTIGQSTISASQSIQQLQNDLEYLLNNPELSDIVFLLKTQNGEPKKLFAHKLILCQRCEYFKVMFSSGMMEATENQVIIDDISYEVFLSLMRYIYCGKLSFRDEDAIYLLAAMNQFGLSEAKKMMKDYFVKKLNIENACLLLEEAEMHEAKELVSCVLKFVEQNTQAVILSKGFEMLSIETMILLLKQNNLTIDELELFEAVVRWAKAKAQQSNEDYKEYLKAVIEYIRFPIMKPIELRTVIEKQYGDIVPTKLLLEAYQFQVLGNIQTPRTVQRKSKTQIAFNPKQKSKWIALEEKDTVARSTRGLDSKPQTCLTNLVFNKRGKFYWEIEIIDTVSPSDIMIGIVDPNNVSFGNFFTHTPRGWGWYANTGAVYHQSLASNYAESFGKGDIIGVLLDLDKEGSLSFFKNEKYMGIAFKNIQGPVCPAVTIYHPSDKVRIVSSNVNLNKNKHVQ